MNWIHNMLFYLCTSPCDLKPSKISTPSSLHQYAHIFGGKHKACSWVKHLISPSAEHWIRHVSFFIVAGPSSSVWLSGSLSIEEQTVLSEWACPGTWSLSTVIAPQSFITTTQHGLAAFNNKIRWHFLHLQENKECKKNIFMLLMHFVNYLWMHVTRYFQILV